jgi:hypothetical protein
MNCCSVHEPMPVVASGVMLALRTTPPPGSGNSKPPA